LLAGHAGLDAARRFSPLSRRTRELSAIFNVRYAKKRRKARLFGRAGRRTAQEQFMRILRLSWRAAARLSWLVPAMLAAAEPVRAQSPADLELTRIALFNSGVGYFEATAQVNGNATAELKFRTDQINDILKSLVVQDFGGGQVGVVGYAARDPIEKTLRSFGVDLTGKPTLGELLNQLRGEPVEVTGLRTLKGSILGVEKEQVLSPDGRTVQVIERLTVSTEAGLQQVKLAEVQSIRLLNEKIDNELQKALATLATAHDADKKTVAISFEGEGQRQVRAAYLLEAPVWKTSYRLELRQDKKPFLQGWAIVENATENDWNNVRLSLISGRPISFRMDLYTPLYVPRPVEQMELYASLRPPEYEAQRANATGRWQEYETAPAEDAAALAPAPGAPTVRARRSKALEISGDGYMELQQEVPMALEGAGVQSVASAAEAGELFEYTIQTPVSIQRQHSAMLPIVNEAVSATKVSIYNPATHAKYPLNGLELTNSTNLNLMQGPVTVYDDNVYAGDAKLPDMKPGEKRLIAYALDLGTEVLVRQKPTPEELVSLRIAKGVLWLRHKYVDQRDYVIKNKLERPREIILEQAYSEDWTLVQPKEPYERARGVLRFRTTVPAGETVTYPLRLERLADQSLALTDLGLDHIRFYLKTKAVSPALQTAMERVVALRTELDEASRNRANLERSLAEAIQDETRIRENLNTLQKDADAYRRQLERFEKLETRIEQLRTHVAELRQIEEQRRKELQQYLLSLNVE